MICVEKVLKKYLMICVEKVLKKYSPSCETVLSSSLFLYAEASLAKGCRLIRNLKIDKKYIVIGVWWSDGWQIAL